MEASIKIFGNVQGVSFRYYTVQKARELNLTGWIKNAPDGTVEILAQGEKKALQKLMAWAREGPQGAEVKKVVLAWRQPQAVFETFEIHY